MEKKYLLFNTEQEALDFAEDANEHMGYVYTKPNKTKHGTYAVITCPMCQVLMTDEQIDSLVSVEYANINLWDNFVPPEPEEEEEV